eukprot:878953-Pleurochrysis_carterae.AAC.1
MDNGKLNTNQLPQIKPSSGFRSGKSIKFLRHLRVAVEKGSKLQMFTVTRTIRNSDTESDGRQYVKTKKYLYRYRMVCRLVSRPCAVVILL